MLKENCCAFSGHRPEKLKYSKEIATKLLFRAISKAIEDGYTTFFSGMAQGIDIWAAQIIIEKKKKTDKNIRLICALPYRDFGKYRKGLDKQEYEFIMKNADEVAVVGEYSKFCYQKRNEYMCDNSTRLIVAFNDIPGGTRNTILYAQRRGMEIINIFAV